MIAEKLSLDRSKVVVRKPLVGEVGVWFGGYDDIYAACILYQVLGFESWLHL